MTLRIAQLRYITPGTKIVTEIGEVGTIISITPIAHGEAEVVTDFNGEEDTCMLRLDHEVTLA